MSLWEIILLGIVQGISEFLPISSSGHLVIIEGLLGHKSENLSLNIALHFGTLLSILVVYRNDILPTLKQPKMVASVVLATIPVVISALLFGDLFKWANNQVIMAGCGLLLTSGLLFSTRRLDNGQRELKDIRLVDALIVGIFQAVTPLPGISRSGTTIFAGMLMGLRRDAAANFAFYIAVPAIAGAVCKELLFEKPPMSISLPALSVGMFVAFVVGVAALAELLKIVTKGRLNWFGWYVLAVGMMTITGGLMGWL